MGMRKKKEFEGQNVIKSQLGIVTSCDLYRYRLHNNFNAFYGLVSFFYLAFLLAVQLAFASSWLRFTLGKGERETPFL